MKKAEAIRITRPQADILHRLMQEWAENPCGVPGCQQVPRQHDHQPCDCDRIGCPHDHSAHYARQAKLRRLLAP